MQQKNLNASRGPYGTYEELEIQMGENRKKPQKLKLTKSKIKSYDAKKKAIRFLHTDALNVFAPRSRKTQGIKDNCAEKRLLKN